MAKEKKRPKVEITNRKASHEYFFVNEFDAGIMLTGTEVKSIRNGNANLSDAYCIFEKDELWIRNLYIAEYEYGTDANHRPRRQRKLLLRKLRDRNVCLLAYWAMNGLVGCKCRVICGPERTHAIVAAPVAVTAIGLELLGLHHGYFCH